MADKTYDVVIVGGGPNALVVGSYLGMNGMSVGIFERTWELGGGGATNPGPLPGFLANPCATGDLWWINPCNEDFDLAKKGSRHVFSDVAQSTAFDDGKAFVPYCLVYFNHDTYQTEVASDAVARINKTMKKVERLSPRDAETLGWIWEAFERRWMIPSFQVLLNPPWPINEPDPLEECYEDPDYPLDPRWGIMPFGELLEELFESVHMRCAVHRVQQSASGTFADECDGHFLTVLAVGFSLGFFPYAMWEGGTHTTIHAIQRAFSEYGGEFFTHSEVDKILIENGKAVGVKLVDGTEVRARRMVVTDVDMFQIFTRFLRDYPVPRMLMNKVKIFKYDRHNLFWGQLAFKERPHYIASQFDPDLEEHVALTLSMVPADWEYVKSGKYKEERLGVRPGKWPTKPVFWENTLSWQDPHYAPPGYHTSLLEEYGPPASWLTDKEWVQLKHEATWYFQKAWQKYAPNMTPENILGGDITTPWDTVRRNINMREGCWCVGNENAHQMVKMRPLHELANHRWKEIGNLYFTGANWHGIGSMSGVHGYNTYKTIAKELDLRKPWDERGRMY